MVAADVEHRLVDGGWTMVEQHTAGVVHSALVVDVGVEAAGNHH